jgi:hypothetical protein
MLSECMIITCKETALSSDEQTSICRIRPWLKVRRIRLLRVPVLYRIRLPRVPVLYRIRLLRVPVLRRIRRMRAPVLYRIRLLRVQNPSHSHLRCPGLARLSLSYHAAGCTPPGTRECTPRSQ